MTLGKTLLIANPASRHGETGKLLPVVRHLFDGVADYDLVTSAAPCDALSIAREATGFDSIVAIGGDGTAHEIVNGIMQRPEGDRPAFGIVPMGSGNDYARTLGMSFDLPAAVRQLVSGERKRLDLGTCNGAWFCNSVAVGLDARVTAKAVEMKVTTGWHGLPLYLRSLLYVLRKQYYGHQMTVTEDGGAARDLGVLAIAITIGETYGGGFRITPGAIPDDGLLDVCRIDPMPRPLAFLRLPLVVLGKHTRLKVAHFSRVKTLRLESERPVEGQIDGEVLLDSAYEIEVCPCCIEVVVPTKPEGR